MTSDHTDKKIFELLEHAERILLLTDERIDGDTTGSTLAMFHFLQSIGKQVRVFSPKPWSQEFEFLPGHEFVIRDPNTFRDGADLLMIFDCADGKYIQDLLPLLPHQTPLIVFDHHETNPGYGEVNQIVKDASSTGEVLWRFFKSNQLLINRDVATCLLTAICTDTTVFSNPATNHVCMEAASELGLAGAKLHEIIRAFYMNKSVHALHLWGIALERLRELPGGVVMTMLSHKDVEAVQALDDDAQGIFQQLKI